MLKELKVDHRYSFMILLTITSRSVQYMQHPQSGTGLQYRVSICTITTLNYACKGTCVTARSYTSRHTLFRARHYSHTRCKPMGFIHQFELFSMIYIQTFEKGRIICTLSTVPTQRFLTKRFFLHFLSGAWTCYARAEPPRSHLLSHCALC